MRKFLGGIGVILILGSCTDAGMVAGKYSGKFFYSDYADTILYRDTMTAQITITEVSSSTIQLNIVTSHSQSFVNIATVTKNSYGDYGINGTNMIWTYGLDGNYNQGMLSFICFELWECSYKFEGQRI